MKKITVRVEGMVCGMCEAHVNDAVRRAFKVKKVSSSHSKGRTEIIAPEDIPDEELRPDYILPEAFDPRICGAVAAAVAQAARDTGVARV